MGSPSVSGGVILAPKVNIGRSLLKNPCLSVSDSLAASLYMLLTAIIGLK